MKVVALVSGGKDSCYNMMQCVSQGHELVALANLKPSNADELDSYMYQTVGHYAIELYSEAMGLPLYRRTIQGVAVEQGKNYNYNPKDEVEDLYELLKNIKGQIKFNGVAVGAILSDYQRVRVENVCSRLGLSCLAYLWRRDQKELLSEMISCRVDAIIIKVAAIGLEPEKHLGKNIHEMYTHLSKLKDKFDCHMCGEGGEYETFTLDCPLFKKKIIIDSSEVIIHSDDAFAPVGYLNFKEMHLENKIWEENPINSQALESIPVFGGDMITLKTEEINEFIKKTSFEENLADDLLDIFHLDNTVHSEEIILITGDVMVKHSEGFAWISGVKVHCTTQSVEDGTDHAMKRLQKTLEEIGTGLEHVLLVHIYVKDMLHYAAVNSVYIKYFDLNPPSRVCVQTNFPDSTVFQLDCLVLIPNGTTDRSMSAFKRDAMHVQSISHWAPANIGPYSQAVKVNDRTGFVAGCIGLWPSSMMIVNGGIDYEAPLALRHVMRILEAVIPGTRLSNVICGVCYVTAPEYVPRARVVWLNFYKKQCQMDCNQEDAMLYVVVPALPKGALVEWHVVSHYCPNQWKCNQLIVDKIKDIKVSLTSFSCFHHMCGSINASVEVRLPLPRKLDISISKMVEDFVEILDNFITSCGQSWDILLLLRIFFRTDVFKNLDVLLRRDFHNLLQKKAKGKCPALVFVPVSKLGKTTQLLSLCCWFQTMCSEDHDD